MNDEDWEPITADDLSDLLVEMRGTFGRLNVHKYARYPRLRSLYGDDLTDGFLSFLRELQRVSQSNGRYEAAAALSLIAPFDTVLDRLVATAEGLSTDRKVRDQRTARNWSDRGMLSLAHDLIAFAEIRGSYGQDLIGITASGTLDCVCIRVIQVSANELPTQSPTVSLPANLERVHEQIVDLDEIRPTCNEHSNTSHTRVWDVESDAFREDNPPQKIKISCRRTPSPVFFLRDETVTAMSGIEFAVHRRLIELTVYRHSE